MKFLRVTVEVGETAPDELDSRVENKQVRYVQKVEQNTMTYTGLGGRNSKHIMRLMVMEALNRLYDDLDRANILK